jgi:hypothetical protein
MAETERDIKHCVPRDLSPADAEAWIAEKTGALEAEATRVSELRRQFEISSGYDEAARVFDERCEDYAEAFVGLVKAAPTTIPGLVALLRYYLEDPDAFDTWNWTSKRYEESDEDSGVVYDEFYVGLCRHVADTLARLSEGAA